MVYHLWLRFYCIRNTYLFVCLINKFQFIEWHTWCTFSRSYLTIRTFWSLLGNKKRTFVLWQRCVFWMMFACGKWCWLRQWWRLRLMMRGFATFYGKHRIIAKRSGATSFWAKRKTSYRREAMHHLTYKRFYDLQARLQGAGRGYIRLLAKFPW